MYNRIYSFLCKHKLINTTQFGFRSKHSTEHALISLIETIKKYLDDGEIVCGVFIDSQKAFDTVNHEILLEKLKHYGIRSKQNDWFRSFLTNRKQYVSMEGFFSQTKIVKCGVPQGSTLGPLLFLIYINDLANALEKSIVHHFADDTNLLYGNKNPSVISDVINSELKLVTDWLRANKLSLNESKTKLLLFRPINKLNLTLSNIKLNGHLLTLAKSVTYLGIEIDETLSWNNQTEVLAKKLSRTNGILSKLRYYILTETLISIYYSLFQSYVLYGSTIWCYTSQKNMKIFILQKRCMRLITFSNFQEHTTPIKNFKILKLQDIIKFNTLKLIYLYYKDQLPLKIKDIFTTNESVNLYNTRGGKLLFISQVNTTHYGIKSLRYNVLVIWNDFF